MKIDVVVDDDDDDDVAREEENTARLVAYHRCKTSSSW